MTIYCTYLTVYRGNKLPQFYIGSTTTSRINSGYKGSVSSSRYKRVWKDEIKNHPELFHTKILTTHATRQEALNRELKFQQQLKVASSPMYVNMAYAQINGCCGVSTKGMPKSSSMRSKLKGNRNAAGNNAPKSPEHRKAISTSLRGRFVGDHQKRAQSQSMKGRSWWTSPSGETSLSHEPPGFDWIKGRHSSSSTTTSS